MEFYTEEKEVKPLKHKFVLNEEQTKRFQHEGWIVKAYVCKTCEAIKVHSRKGRFTTSTLMRNGRISEFLECVDLVKENLKTID